jgi:preprotein translocase subunit YajC
MTRNKILILGLLVVGLLASLVFMSGCMQTTEEGGTTFDWTWIVFLVIMVAVFYFILIRPQQKRQKEHRQLMDELKRGDRVITAGGIYGQVESVSDDNVVVKVESGATIRVAKGSVSIKRTE